MPDSKKTSRKFDPAKLREMLSKAFNDESVFEVLQHEDGKLFRIIVESSSSLVCGYLARDEAEAIVYLLNHAYQLAEIVDAFKDVVDGTGAEMLESCTGLPYARCKEITKTFAELID